MSGDGESQAEDGQQTVESVEAFLAETRAEKHDSATLHKIDLTQQAKELLDSEDGIGGILHYLEARGVNEQLIKDNVRSTRTEYGDFGEGLLVRDYLNRRTVALQKAAEHSQEVVLGGNNPQIEGAYE